jgi:chromosome segregation ATPase
MRSPHLFRPLAVCLPLALTGCGIFGDSRPGLAKVDDLVERIEQVHVESELAKQAADHAVERLAVLTASPADPVQAHAELSASVTESERQAERLRQGIAAMEGAAEPVFRQWRSDLDAIVSARVRTRSEQRLRETRERYAEIVARVRPAVEEYEALNRSLRDLSLFLGHDYNQSAVLDVGDDVRALERQAAALGDQLDRSLAAARSYLEAASLPAAGELAEPPAEPLR